MKNITIKIASLRQKENIMTTFMKTTIRTILISLFAMMITPLFASAAHANGRLIIPAPPIPRPRFQPLILERQEVKTTIDGQIARTHIRQIWRNNNRMQLEGEFLFPLPADRATMSDFVLWMDGKKLTFETMEAGKARNIYEDIVRRMRDPGLLEHAGDGLLRCRIYPIPANGTKEIELEYREVITKEGTLSKYAFPLEIRGLNDPIGTLIIDVEINSSSPMGRIYSPTHDIGIDMHDSKHARATLEKSYYRPTREFVLFMTHPQKEFGVELITHKPSGEDGYFLGLISPRFDYDTSGQKPIPKDFLFILDTSGSMEGEKIKQAKEALRYILRNLNPDDRFGVINFSSDVHKFRDSLSSVSAVNDALNYVDGLAAVGGTYIDGALKEGLKFVGGGNRPFYIIFLTDGLPTIGEQNTDNILRNAKKANERDARVFSFGVGDDVNIAFIDKLARENGGASSNVAPSEDLEIPLSNLYQKIKSPVLTDLNLDVSGVRAYDIYPKELPDLFKGSQLIITGRYTGSGNAKISLKGKLRGASSKTFSYSKKFSSYDENTFIPPLWANRKVGYLLNQVRLYGENQETIDQVIKLAKRYGIITPYTSYLVLEDSSIPPPGIPMPMPIEMSRSGRDSFSSGRSYGEGGAGGMAGGVVKGKAARNVSKSLAMKEEAESLDAVEHDGEGSAQGKVQHVEDKTFILKNDYWVDSEYDPDDKLKEIEIEFMSDEYFNLMDKFPDISEYLAVGDNIKLVWEGKVYIITSDE